MLPILLVAVMLIATMGTAHAQAPGPKYGGSFVIGEASSEPPILTFWTNTFDRTPGTEMFNGLVSYDSNYNPIPDLAQSWSFSPDGLTWTFKLVQNATWHDGVPLTSADVVFSYGFSTHQTPLSSNQSLIPHTGEGQSFFTPAVGLAGVSAPDKYTVVFRWTHPYFEALVNMGVFAAPIGPAHIYNGTNVFTNPYNNKPVGTGPFMYKEWVRGDHITLVKNPTYFKKGLPFLDQVILKAIPDTNTLVAALQSGDVDFVPEGLPYELLPQLNSNPQFNPVPLHTTNIGMLDRMLFNNDEPLFKDVRVRQAFSLAIDRQQVINVAASGHGTVSKCIWPASTGMAQYCDPSLTYPEYNVTKAGQLLDQAGYRMQPNGTRIVLHRFLVDNGEPATSLGAAQVIRDMLAKVGIMTTIVQVDGNTRLHDVFEARPRLFDISMHKGRTGPSPLFARKQFDSNFNTPNIFTNTGFSDPVSDALWRQVAFNATTNAQRVQLFQQISKRLAGLYPELEIYDYVYAQPLRHSFQGTLFYYIIPESGPSENLWFAGTSGAATTIASMTSITSATPTALPSWAIIVAVIAILLVAAYFVYSKKKKK